MSGRLCIKRPTPGMARTIYGDHERFLDTYYRPHPGLSVCVYVHVCLFIVYVLCLSICLVCVFSVLSVCVLCCVLSGRVLAW